MLSRLRLTVETNIPSNTSLALAVLRNRYQNAILYRQDYDRELVKRYDLTQRQRAVIDRLKSDVGPDLLRFVIKDPDGPDGENEWASVAVYRSGFNGKPIVDAVWLRGDGWAIEDLFLPQRITGIAIAHMWLLCCERQEDFRRLPGMEGSKFENNALFDPFEKVDDLENEDQEMKRLGRHSLSHSRGIVVTSPMREPWIGKLNTNMAMYSFEFANDLLKMTTLNVRDPQGNYHANIPLENELHIAQPEFRAEIQRASGRRMYSGSSHFSETSKVLSARLYGRAKNAKLFGSPS